MKYAARWVSFAFSYELMWSKCVHNYNMNMERLSTRLRVIAWTFQKESNTSCLYATRWLTSWKGDKFKLLGKTSRQSYIAHRIGTQLMHLALHPFVRAVDVPRTIFHFAPRLSKPYTRSICYIRITVTDDDLSCMIEVGPRMYHRMNDFVQVNFYVYSALQHVINIVKW